MAVIELPEGVEIRHQNLWLEAPDGSAGPGLDGGEQITATENRVWIGEVTLPDMTRDTAMALTAFADDLRGRANIWRMPLINDATARYGAGEPLIYAALGLFEPGDPVADYGKAELTADAGIGLSTISADGDQIDDLKVGAWFADANDNGYRVAAVSGADVRFNPPLRAALATGDRINVSQPFLQVRLADQKELRPVIEYAHYGRAVTVKIREALPR